MEEDRNSLDRCIIAQRLRDFAATFAELESDVRRERARGRAWAVGDLQTLTEAGELVIDAVRRGMLSKIGGLRERVAWHAGGDGPHPGGKPHNYCRSPINLFFELCGELLPRLYPAVLPPTPYLELSATMAVSDPEKGEFDRLFAAKRRGRLGAACRILAQLVEGENIKDGEPLTGQAGPDAQSTLAQQIIERWRQTAADAVDDIGGWRDADSGDRSIIYWAGAASIPPQRPELPPLFYGHTTYLVGWIVSHYPKLDPTPLQDIYAAIAAWYEDHNADRVPPQPILYATLKRAITVLQAVEMDLQRRVLNDDPCKGRDRIPTAETSGSDGPAGGKVAAPQSDPEDSQHEHASPMARALGVLAEHPDWTDKAIAKAARVSRQSLYRWPTYLAARREVRDAGRDHRAARSLHRGKPRRPATGDTFGDTQGDTSAESS